MLSRALLSRRNVLATVATVWAALGILVLSGAPAQAALTYPYGGVSFGPEGLGGGTFGNVKSVTVDQSSGDVYVYDEVTQAIYKFNATGEPVNFSSTGTNAIEGVTSFGGNAEQEIAVDSSTGPASGDIYLANNEVVDIYSALGTKLGEISGGERSEGQEACGVAVDPTGAVYVGFYPETVNKYMPTADPLDNADYAGSLTGVTNVCNVAADAQGDLYAAAYNGGVTKYEASQFNMLGVESIGTSVDSERGQTLAVDYLSGAVYVDEGPEVVVYDASGKLLARLGSASPGAIANSRGVAVDGASGAVYMDGGEGEVPHRVELFDSTEIIPDVSLSPVSSLQATSVTLGGTVDADGAGDATCLFEYGTGGVYDHSVPCSPATIPSSSGPVAVEANVTGLQPDATSYSYRLVASNANGTSYSDPAEFATAGPTIDDESVANVSASSAELRAQIDPRGSATTYYFQYGPTSSYGDTMPAPPGAEIGEGSSDEGVVQRIRGLLPSSTYHYRVVAVQGSEVSVGSDQTFTTNPTIAEESVADVSATSAELRGQIDPRGIATTYYFQYGPTSSYGDTMPATPGVSVGPAESDESVTQRISGLAPNSTYHYSIVVVQGTETTVGSDRTFTTSVGVSDFQMLDGRAWEMVSPVQKDAGQVLPPKAEGGAIQAAADGHAFTYLTDASIGENPPGNPTRSQIFSVRSSTGWSSQDISPPRETSIRVGTGEADHFFSTDLSGVISEPFIGEGLPLAPGVPSELQLEIYSYNTSSNTYNPLVTSLPPQPEGSETAKLLQFQYASRDAKHVVFSTDLALTPEALPASNAYSPNNLYEWSDDGSLRLINVLPDGTATAGDAMLGNLSDGERIGTVSDDGSHVIWADSVEGSSGPLYETDLQTGKTLAVDAPQGGSGQAGRGIYRMASIDGRRVFFTSPAALTADANTSEGESGLYEFDSQTDTLLDVTPDSHDASGAQVQVVIGINEEGSSVYFTARGALAPGASAGKVNLYMSHLQGSGWKTTFIATVTENDFLNFNRDTEGNLPREDIAARVSPDGRFLAFTSSASLTGYDNRDLSSGQPDEEVYLYDSDSQQLVCASCKPNGERPSGMIVIKGEKIDSGAPWAGSSVAALLPGWTAMSVGKAYYQPRYLSDSGRLFFDSADALVPHDTGGQVDVYEFEPQGVGDCARASVSGSTVFVDGSDGCVGLISSGTSTRESIFLDASEDGSNVFFMTNAKLSRADVDEASDVYDARECSGASPCIPQPAVQPPACATAEACRAAPTPQPTVFGPQSTATFNGAGNLAPNASPTTVTQGKKKAKPLTRSQELAKKLRLCKREPKRKQASCQARARKRYGEVKMKRRSSRRARGKAKTRNGRSGR